MKKSGIVGIVALFGTLALTSCNKDYTCNCTTTDSSGSMAPSSEQFTITNSNKDDATASCNLHEFTDGPISTECELN